MTTLSVCIASMNRLNELTEVVQNLLSSSEGLDVEVVVADASPAGEQLSIEHERLRVVLLDRPNGVDNDYSTAIENASGLYCWLFTDDDRPDPDCVRRILEQIKLSVEPLSLLLVDARVVTPDNVPLLESMLPMDFPGRLEAGAGAREFVGAKELLTFIGSVVVRRSLWLERYSSAYVGSEFRHVGLLLSAPLPGPTVVLGPAITVKYGVAHWESRAVRVWTKQWPSVIRESVHDRTLWSQYFATSLLRQCYSLLTFRARKLLSSENCSEAFPDETRPRVRSAFKLISKCPIGIARVAVLGTAVITRSDTRQLRFDLRRAIRL